MSEELETPQEHVEHQIHDEVHHSKERWIFGVALTAAIFAALAAVTNLMSGHHEHEAMLNTVKASDQWSYYQAEGIKAAILEGRAVAGSTDEKTDAKIEKYADKRKELRAEAEGLQSEALGHEHHHITFARAVTMFQVAIAIAAISALTKRRSFWFASMVIGLVGVVFAAQGLFQ